MSGSRKFFFFITKNFSGTDIYHSDIKNALLQFFLLPKNCFSKFAKLLVRSKFYLNLSKKLKNSN